MQAGFAYNEREVFCRMVTRGITAQVSNMSPTLDCDFDFAETLKSEINMFLYTLSSWSKSIHTESGSFNLSLVAKVKLDKVLNLFYIVTIQIDRMG